MVDRRRRRRDDFAFALPWVAGIPLVALASLGFGFTIGRTELPPGLLPSSLNGQAKAD